MNEKKLWSGYSTIVQMKIITLWKLMLKENKSWKERDLEMHLTLELEHDGIEYIHIPYEVLHRFTNTQ